MRLLESDSADFCHGQQFILWQMVYSVYDDPVIVHAITSLNNLQLWCESSQHLSCIARWGVAASTFIFDRDVDCQWDVDYEQLSSIQDAVRIRWAISDGLASPSTTAFIRKSGIPLCILISSMMMVTKYNRCTIVFEILKLEQQLPIKVGRQAASQSMMYNCDRTIFS